MGRGPRFSGFVAGQRHPGTAEANVVRLHPGTDLAFDLVPCQLVQLVDRQLAERHEDGAADRSRIVGR